MQQALTPKGFCVSVVARFPAAVVTYYWRFCEYISVESDLAPGEKDL